MATAIEQIQTAAANWSIEVTPTGATKIESFRDCLDEGTTVNVTFLPGSDPADTIADPGRRVFAGMLSAVDEAMANVTAALKAKGMYDDVLFVVTTE